MDLPRAGREYAHVTLEGLPAGATPEVQVGDGAWTALEPDGADGWRFLVYGPDAPTGDGIPIIAPSNAIRVRVVDTPETVIRRAAGSIRLA